MGHVPRHLVLVAALAASTTAIAGGYGRVYLVRALKECKGAATCGLEFESTYTFDSIVLRSPASKYEPAGKPMLILEIRGVRDAAGTPVNGNLTLRLASGRVYVPSVGTFPDDSPYTVQPPIPIPLKNGNKRFAYTSALPVPNGLIVNGGGVEILDPAGKLLAVTGSQTKP